MTAGAITLGNSNGRFMSTQSVGGSSTLQTFGADSSYTRITVQRHAVQQRHVNRDVHADADDLCRRLGQRHGQLDGDPEGLTGEGTYAPVAVPYSGDSVTSTVTADAINLAGR